MNLAQSTFQRLLTSAREKLTRGIVEGKAIRIEGGPYHLVPRTFVCPKCGRRWRREVEGQAAGTGEAEARAESNCPSCGSAGLHSRRPGRGKT